MESAKRFEVGDKVTYKDKVYAYGGKNQKGYVGQIIDYLGFESERNCWKIRVSTSYDYNYTMLESEFEEYDHSAPKFETDLVLEQAKARYTVGTIFIPAHINKSSENFCIITEDSCIERIDDKIYSSINGNLHSLDTKHGNNDMNRLIYSDHYGWAKIIGNKYKDGVDPMISKYKGEFDWKINPYPKLNLPSDYLTTISLHKSDSEKPLIEPVHSVSVQLRTKKKSKQLTI